MTAELTLPPALNMERLIELALATCASPETRRMYSVQLRKFIASGLPLNREGVALHIQRERDAGKGGSTLISATAAIRKLAGEAQIRGLMSLDELNQIKSVSVGTVYKSAAGVWLTLRQVERLLGLPDRSGYWGCRDACLLSVMLGCGLRRAEMASLKWPAYHSRDGRPCIHVIGKGSKSRVLPVPEWAITDIDAWQTRRLTSPPRFDADNRYLLSTRSDMNHNYITGGLAADTIHKIVYDYGQRLGVNLAPHDLRRTLAQMLRKAGAPLEQIQYTLGHENIATTVLYLGSKLELGKGLAAVDLIKLNSTD